MRLPNFMCIGASKSGTTTLYEILKKHSQVFLPSFKEPHFFDNHFIYKNGLDWYFNTYFKRVKDEKRIGDFTPSYLFEKESAKRIFCDLGQDVKFIVILRNPVDRAYSLYLHSKRDQHETLSFKNALKMEKERLNNARKQNDYLSELRLSYIEQGLYGRMLEQYFKYFSKDNFLIIHFEDEFIKKRGDTINRIFSFLELQNEQLNINIKSNTVSTARSVWLKKILKKKGIFRNLLKKIIPSLMLRQILINKIHKLNNKNFTPPFLSIEDKEKIFDKYFAADVIRTENLLNRKMNWNKCNID